TGYVCRISGCQAQERRAGVPGRAEVVDLDGSLLSADRPERHRVLVETKTERRRQERTTTDRTRERADGGELRRGAPRPPDEMRRLRGGEGLLHRRRVRASDRVQREWDQEAANGHTILPVHVRPLTRHRVVRRSEERRVGKGR